MTSPVVILLGPRARRTLARLLPAPLAIMAFSSPLVAQAPDDTVNAWRVIGDQETAQTLHSTIGQRAWVFTCTTLDCRATLDSTRSAYYAFGVRRSGLVTTEEWNGRAQASTLRAMRAGLWRVVEAGRSAMTGDSQIIVSVRGSGRVRWSHLGPPELVIRCLDRQLALYITVNAILGGGLSHGDAPVRLRFDNEQATTQSWSTSTGGQAAFADEPVWVISRIMTADVLRVEYQPFDAVAEVATFRVAGVGRPLRRIAHACPGYSFPLLPDSTGSRRHPTRPKG
jgi:hypothetical protein